MRNVNKYAILRYGFMKKLKPGIKLSICPYYHSFENPNVDECIKSINKILNAK